MEFSVIGYWGGYPAENGATSAYMIKKDGFNLVIDMGSGAVSKLQKYVKIEQIDAVILSHYHHDHVADVGVLQYARLVKSYVTGETAVLPIYGHEEDETGFKSLTHDYTKGVAYDPSHSLEIGPFSITFLRTAHSVPCFGMRITDGERVIVYTADTAFQEEWIPFAAEADLLVTDCNFYANQDGEVAGHMTSKEGAMIAERANVGELILSHLPQYGDRFQLVKEAEQYYKGNIRLASEGLTWKK